VKTVKLTPNKLSGWKNACAVFLFCAAAAIASPAQTFTTLFTFNGNDGAQASTLVQGFDGNLYGTTPESVFKITTDGVLTTLTNFCIDCGDLANGVTLGSDGNFYGTNQEGGGGGSFGTIFKVTPAGVLTVLHRFEGAEGFFPFSPPIEGFNGIFYGTTIDGGAHNLGTIYKITAGGAFTTLYSFCSQTGCPDGEYPFGALILASDGNLYGTTERGGPNNSGTIFKITPSGKLTTLHTFTGTDGDSPVASLLQAGQTSSAWGTASRGGKRGVNDYSSGTIFAINRAGKFSKVYNFCSLSNCSDGSDPGAALVLATDGNFYGTTQFGGDIIAPTCTAGCGTVFQITPTGVLTTLHSFCGQTNCPDGESPYASVVQATNGILYGTTQYGGQSGGPSNGGTIFSLSMGLAPFVKTVPVFGAVGSPVVILGNNLTGASGVSFNGTAATFTVVSDTQINATVPTGATTGMVSVTTASGTLNSNAAFQVVP
jgi:uncharacterized repeat protein (TIGR03803 family)